MPQWTHGRPHVVALDWCGVERVGQDAIRAAGTHQPGGATVGLATGPVGKAVEELIGQAEPG